MVEEKKFKSGDKIKVDPSGAGYVTVCRLGGQRQIQRHRTDILHSEIYQAEWDYIDDFQAQDIFLMLVFVQPGGEQVVLSYFSFTLLFDDEPDGEGVYRRRLPQPDTSRLALPADDE